LSTSADYVLNDGVAFTYTFSPQIRTIDLGAFNTPPYGFEILGRFYSLNNLKDYSFEIKEGTFDRDNPAKNNGTATLFLPPLPEDHIMAPNYDDEELGEIMVIYRVELRNVMEHIELGHLPNDVDGTKPEPLLDYLAEQNPDLNKEEVELILRQDGKAYLKPKKNGLYDMAFPGDSFEITYKTNLAFISYQDKIKMKHFLPQNSMYIQEKTAFYFDFYNQLRIQNNSLNEAGINLGYNNDYDLFMEPKQFSETSYFGNKIFSNYEIDLEAIFQGKEIILPKGILEENIPEKVLGMLFS
jgi:hypothetical protein